MLLLFGASLTSSVPNWRSRRQPPTPSLVGSPEAWTMTFGCVFGNRTSPLNFTGAHPAGARWTSTLGFLQGFASSSNNLMKSRPRCGPFPWFPDQWIATHTPVTPKFESHIGHRISNHDHVQLIFLPKCLSNPSVSLHHHYLHPGHAAITFNLEAPIVDCPSLTILPPEGPLVQSILHIWPERSLKTINTYTHTLTH